MMKKIGQAIGLGIPIGVTCGLVMSLLFSYLYSNTYYPSSPRFTDQFQRPLDAISVSILLWALMGIVFALSSLIFDVERWSMARRTAVHFLASYIPFTLLALLAKWFPAGWGFLLSYTLIYLGIYVAMWLSFYLAARHYVAAVNKKLAAR
ncbi:DUF3021 domain-containing protein [Lacticaseibacillus mingshuiensis]|uniref:DUF3021 domain-containing protein n=1 Tax=Lacticaseibacillus mingshuiensis TaxID=2799574 RepID=UPI00194E577D|nr:DUF3021 domain-containing protein [Lacticaseibacillus mingshuiensis]